MIKTPYYLGEVTGRRQSNRSDRYSTNIDHVQPVATIIPPSRFLWFISSLTSAIPAKAPSAQLLESYARMTQGFSSVSGGLFQVLTTCRYFEEFSMIDTRSVGSMGGSGCVGIGMLLRSLVALGFVSEVVI